MHGSFIYLCQYALNILRKKVNPDYTLNTYEKKWLHIYIIGCINFTVDIYQNSSKFCTL